MNAVFIKRTASLKSAVIQAEQMLSGRIWLFAWFVCGGFGNMVQLTFMPIKQSRTNYLIWLISFSLIRLLNINLYAGIHLKSFLAMKAACSLKQQSVHKFHSSSFHHWSLFRLDKQMFQVHRGLLCFPLWWRSNFSFSAISRSNPSTSEDMMSKQIFRSAKHEHAGILGVHFNMKLAFRSSKEAISVPLRTLTENQTLWDGKRLWIEEMNKRAHGWKQWINVKIWILQLQALAASLPSIMPQSKLNLKIQSDRYGKIDWARES